MEFIGLLFGLFVFLGLATGLGVAVAAVVSKVIARSSYRKWVILTGAMLPPLCVIYLVLCAALLPGESLFGDISEPLPNGYSLQALGKMPDFASINKGDSFSAGNVMLTECVGSIAVAGPLIAGAYSHPYASFNPTGDDGYFIFDTTNGSYADYKTQTDLERKLGHPVHLIQTSTFHSEEPSYKLLRTINRLVLFGPVSAAWMAYILWLLRLRRANDQLAV